VSRAPLVLAIEPDLRQAAIVKRVVRERVQADVVVVDSRDAAIAAIRTAIPDVLLVSALLSPRDEDDLISHLRTLEGASHLQTHTIPQLASALGPGEGGRGGLLSAFRRKKPSGSAPAGCDPDLFADEIGEFLRRAADRKREAAESGVVTPLPARTARIDDATVTAAVEEPAAGAGSSWASPFEWRPTVDRRTAPAAPGHPAAIPLSADPESATTDVEPPIPDLESLIADPLTTDPEPALETLASPIPDSELPIPVPPRVHTPAPFAVWAKQETAKPTAVRAVEDGGFEGLFATAIPADVASVAYATGVRIRRVRVRAAKDAHPVLHAAMARGRRMIADLGGSDASA
jgi:hypothetical protein